MKSGIVVELVRYSKDGRLCQFAEAQSEAAQMLEADGWKASGNKVLFEEVAN